MTGTALLAVFGAGIYYFKLHGAFGGDSFCARTQLTY
jgi:hypothetical protein